MSSTNRGRLRQLHVQVSDAGMWLSLTICMLELCKEIRSDTALGSNAFAFNLAGVRL